MKFLFVILLFCKSLAGQKTTLPPLDSLYANIDRYYNSLTASQVLELQSSNKYKWFSYIPSPGYSPFAGGFTMSLNISAPLNAINNNHLNKMKAESIRRINSLNAIDLKNAVFAEYESILNAIDEFDMEDSVEYYKDKAYNLVLAKYERSEITPTELLAQKQAYHAYRLQRHIAASNIRKQILQLLIKSKTAIASNNDGLKL